MILLINIFYFTQQCTCESIWSKTQSVLCYFRDVSHSASRTFSSVRGLQFSDASIFLLFSKRAELLLSFVVIHRALRGGLASPVCCKSSSLYKVSTHTHTHSPSSITLLFSLRHKNVLFMCSFAQKCSVSHSDSTKCICLTDRHYTFIKVICSLACQTNSVQILIDFFTQILACKMCL